MTIINPDHEAVIAAFHRAAARAGTGGDGRYARAVTHLEPSVRRDLEARAEPVLPPAERQAVGEVVEAPCPRCGEPVHSWTAIEATAVCLHCTEIAPQPPAEAQAQGGGEVAGILRTAVEYHRAQATGPCDQFGNKASRRNLKLEAWHRQVADAIEAITTPPSAPVGADAVLRDAVQGLIDFIEIDNLPMDADAMFIAKRALAQQPAADTVTVQQAWEWAGGNPGIKATREDLQQALRDLDAVCDDADRQPAAVGEDAAITRMCEAYYGVQFSYSKGARDKMRRLLHAALAGQQPAAVDGARFRKAPCYLCGYNGAGYFQPETHPCAALYHAAQPGGSDND